MSAAPVIATERSRPDDPVWKATAVAGVAQLAGLAIALTGRSPAVVSLAVAAAGVVVAAFVLMPRAIAALQRHPVLVVVTALMAIGPLCATLELRGTLTLGDTVLLPLALMSLATTGGVVLIADAVRVRLGLTPHGRAPWRQLTTAPTSRDAFPWRAIPGLLLIGWAAFLGIGIAGPYADSSAMQVLVLVVVAGAAAVAIGTPMIVGSLTRVDRDQAQNAREDERQRFAAHLHDSVLQTLALVQRQAHDPVAVVRLARRQEHSLRAWMAGEIELLGDTLVAALRGVAAEVEDEHGITVELTAIGDRPLDGAGEALVAAAREALRNAARHAGGAGAGAGDADEAAGSAGGAPILVFAELTPVSVEVFVRDEGVGFDPQSVAPERRGIRDAIVGRMAVVGGRATIESAPGEGTEVALRLGEAPPAKPGR